MKKQLALIVVTVGSIFGFALLAQATVTSWDFSGGVLQPLQSQWSALVKANRFTATSTSQASVFPYASTTAISVSSLTNGNCVQAGVGGFLTTVGSPCGSGGGGITQIDTTYPVQGGPITTTGTISLAFGTTTSNTWAGTQTFTNSPVFSTLTAGTVNSTSAGTVYNTATSTPTVTSPITYSGTLGAFIGGIAGAFGCNVASGSQAGCLSSTDWTVFNNKVSSSSLASYVTAFKDWGIQNGAITPTTTLGIQVNASSTIGDSSQTGGLTINGGATTTGNALIQASLDLNAPNIVSFLTLTGNTSVAGSQIRIIDSTTANNLYTSILNPSGASNSNANTIPLSATFSLGSGTTGGLVFSATTANGPIRFFSGGLSLTSNLRAIITGPGLFGIGSSTPWKLLSVGSSNTGTFAISTSTAGCAQFSPFGELFSTTLNCNTSFPFTPTNYGVSTSTIVGFTQGILTAASSTFNGGIRVDNSTTTNATSTTLFATTASTTNFFGAGLSPCITTNALTWTGGSFSCTAQPQGTVTAVTATWPIISSGGSTPNLTWGGIASSSPIAAGAAVLYATGVNTFASVATSTPTVTSPITYSGTLGNFVGGVGGAFGCATCLTANQTITLSGAVTGSGSTAIATTFGAAAANTVLGNATGGSAVPTFLATSTGLGILHSTLGNLAWTNSGHTGTANTIPYFGPTGAAVEVATSSLNLSVAGLAPIAANTVIANGTGVTATPTAYATSSLFTWIGTGSVVRAISPTITNTFDVMNDGGSATFNFTSYRASANHNKFAANAARGTLASPSVLSSADAMFEINGNAWDGSAFQSTARVIFAASGTQTGSSLPSEINFYTTPSGGTAGVKNMTLEADGSITITTTKTSVGASTLCWDGSGASSWGGCSSLRSLKMNITPTDLGLTDLMKLQPVEYDWNPDKIDARGHNLGLIADDVAVAIPVLAEHGGKDGALSSWNQMGMIALTVKAVQELNTKVENLSVGIVEVKRSAEENWQWYAIGALVVWNLYLTVRRRK